MKTKITNLGMGRFIRYLPPVKRQFDPGESFTFDGDLDTQLALYGQAGKGLKQLEADELNGLIEIIYNFEGRRATGLGAPVSDSDAVTLAYLEEIVDELEALLAARAGYIPIASVDPIPDPGAGMWVNSANGWLMFSYNGVAQAVELSG